MYVFREGRLVLDNQPVSVLFPGGEYFFGSRHFLVACSSLFGIANTTQTEHVVFMYLGVCIYTHTHVHTHMYVATIKEREAII